MPGSYILTARKISTMNFILEKYITVACNNEITVQNNYHEYYTSLTTIWKGKAN